MGSSPLTRGKLHGRALHVESDGLIPAHAGKTTGLLRRGFCVRAHPRSRGENVLEAQGEGHRQGSSPLTRGKPTRPVSRSMPTTAHPRSRGENTLDGLIVDKATGSSPLTRGKRKRLPLDDLGTRLIPAHAGKTYVYGAATQMEGAHPRSRGENCASCRPPCSRTGSSPLTRGKPRHDQRARQRLGLIPAHAGKTTVGGARAVDNTAHPRSRGENHPARMARICAFGSSPLTRGKLLDAAQEVSELGLIPAHAGKTTRSWITVADEGAHPRSRGENGTGNREQGSTPGSSPLTRGKLTISSAWLRPWGLIPAHAGKTRSSSS